jgi:hypothetical protein
MAAKNVQLLKELMPAVEVIAYLVKRTRSPLELLFEIFD